MAVITVEMDSEKLEKITQPLSVVLNQIQLNGFTIDEVLCGMMVLLGSAIAQRGGRLKLDAPLREALPAIVLGY